MINFSIDSFIPYCTCPVAPSNINHMVDPSIKQNNLLSYHNIFRDMGYSRSPRRRSRSPRRSRDSRSPRRRRESRSPRRRSNSRGRSPPRRRDRRDIGDRPR